MNIKFFLSDVEMAPTTIAGKQLAKALQDQGYNVEIVQDANKKKNILINADCDVIFFQKTFYPGHKYEDVEHLKGKVYLIYIDDDFLGMNQVPHLKALDIADLILVGNQKHAQLLKDYTKIPGEVIYSISDFQNYPYVSFEERNNHPLKIFWQQNLADAYVQDLLMVKDTLIRIYENYNVEIRLYGWHQGRHYGWPDKSIEVRKEMPFAKFIPFQPLENYLKEIVPEISKCDICIAPYIDIPDRYGKSAYGLKRTMMMGIPVVASDFGVHQELIIDGVNGYLAKDEDEWYAKIEDLILKPELRRKFSLNARNAVESQYSYQKCVDVFLEALKKHIPPFITQS
ncbi:glycosyltransferase [Petroclostridium sp. X23]|uniref:glycosyltransferase n=1 Tax=Petroclostridium sp. X23 TaxID=3045146 RepID=UPI0024AD7054|nr:glycosyltransferase [Petroclostridium sp. X23]WHH58337.1 glycosyltransferase [Petroclostridium sp. X23]